eukprot:SAG22_NODE_430_length_10586_cov_6.817202_4_plen_1059_part_00
MFSEIIFKIIFRSRARAENSAWCCLQDPIILKKMMRLYLNRRHLKLSIISIAHSLTGKGALPYTIRKNLSHLIRLKSMQDWEVWGDGAAAPMVTEGSQHLLAVNLGPQHSVNLGVSILAVIAVQLQYVIMRGISVPLLEEFLEKQPFSGAHASTSPNHIITYEPSKNTSASAEKSNATWKQGNTPTANRNQTQGRRAQESPTCTNGADMQGMLSVCCVDSNGHRRTQTGCDSLPDQCPEICAPVFLSFYASCPVLNAKIEGAAAFRDKCAEVGQVEVPQPPPPAPPSSTASTCVDSTTWRGVKGQGCGQYEARAESTWRSACNIDRAVVSPEMVAESTDMFGSTVQGQTASEACPLSCGACPTCNDRMQNGDETGVDCGGSCALICDPNVACEPFAQSQFVPANSRPVCTDGAGVAPRAVCHLIANPGFYTASIGAAAAVCTRQECEALATTMFIPPLNVNPGEWTCTDGQWVGFALPLLPIVPAMCDAFIKENHYSAACATDGSPCQATCDDGYPQAAGDGVFSCINGRWVGHLVCLPTDCGPTLDQQPVARSAFGECVDGTTLGSACEARCKEGFYAESGSGVASFTCEENEYGGLWLQQGHAFYESSLVCAMCPTIEHCAVSSCSTGTDAVCAECESDFYAFRHDETPTRCLIALGMTMMAASFTADATGNFVFTVPANTTLQAGNGGSVSVPPSASLTVHGSADGSSVLDVESISVEGVFVISGVVVEASIDVSNGGSLSLQSVGGSITDLAVANSRFSMDAASVATLGGTIHFENADAVELTQKTIVEGNLTVSGGSSLSLQSVGGSITGLSVVDSRFSMDVATKSQMTFVGAVRLDGSNVGLSFSGKTLDGVSFTISNGAQLELSGCNLVSDGSSIPLTVESGGAATVTQTVFRSTAGDITAVSISDGGSMTVGESQLVGADGSAHPFPCDGTLPDCAGEHAGSVVVEGPSVINMAVPLVCDVETGECLSNLPEAFVVVSGPCTVSQEDRRRCVGRREGYGPNEECTITVAVGGRVGTCTLFDIFSGNKLDCPHPLVSSKWGDGQPDPIGNL